MPMQMSQQQQQQQCIKVIPISIQGIAEQKRGEESKNVIAQHRVEVETEVEVEVEMEIIAKLIVEHEKEGPVI